MVLYAVDILLTAAVTPTAIPMVAPELNLLPEEIPEFVFDAAVGPTYLLSKDILKGSVTFNISNERVGLSVLSLPKTIKTVSLFTVTPK
jgi:hypothetical protein